MFKNALYFICLFLHINQANAQSNDLLKYKIDSLLETIQPRAFNGVVRIAQHGKCLYSKAHGYSNFDAKSSLRWNDRFSTMSIAKQVTATLILLEVEKGTIELDVPIRKYLPNLTYSWADTVTVHQLLNHTSGLDAENLDYGLKFTPGSSFSYSNIAYSIAGKILENQSGKSFEELVATLFKKCHMKSSGYPSQANSKKMTKGHTIAEDGNAYLNERINFSSEKYFGSHLIVTASDLVRWNECLHNGKILKENEYKLMTNYNITAMHSLFGPNPIGYGLGLRINDKMFDYIEIGHTGFHPAEGFTAVNLYYPEFNISVIVLENQANENFSIAYHFEKEIRKIVLEYINSQK